MPANLSAYLVEKFHYMIASTQNPMYFVEDSSSLLIGCCLYHAVVVSWPIRFVAFGLRLSQASKVLPSFGPLILKDHLFIHG